MQQGQQQHAAAQFAVLHLSRRQQPALFQPLNQHRGKRRVAVRRTGGCVVLHRQRLAQFFHANITLAGNNPQVTAWHGEHLNKHMADGNFRCLLAHTFRGGHLQRLAGEQVQPFYQRGKINLDHKRPYRSNLFSWYRMSCVWLSSRNR